MTPTPFWTQPANGHMYVAQPTYHIQTQLPDGRQAILLDIGSVGNLGGDKWAKRVAIEAAKRGRKPNYTRRQRPLKVGGVGNGTQACGFDCNLPVAFRHSEKKTAVEGNITIPTVNDSELPGLLGLTALRKNKAIIDL